MTKEQIEKRRQEVWADNQRIYAERELAMLKMHKVMERITLGASPYLASKGFHGKHALIYRGAITVVPMRNEAGDLVNLQFISPEGDKRFMKGLTWTGSRVNLGVPNASLKLYCEGYATGLSILDATKRLGIPAHVVVCITGYGMEALATTDTSQNSFVVADHDTRLPDTHDTLSQEHAERTGKKWFMPLHPDEDFNDFWQRVGREKAAHWLGVQIMRTEQ